LLVRCNAFWAGVAQRESALGSKARLSGTPAARQVYPREQTFALHVGKVSDVPEADLANVQW